MQTAMEINSNQTGCVDRKDSVDKNKKQFKKILILSQNYEVLF